MGEVKFKPGGFLSGQVFTLTDTVLKFKGAYTGYATVPRSAIELVLVEPVSAGKSNLKLIGKGTDLASITLPNSWAEQTMEWLMNELKL